MTDIKLQYEGFVDLRISYLPAQFDLALAPGVKGASYHGGLATEANRR